MRSAKLVALALLGAGALLARAADAPHENGDGVCSNCHRGHNAPGASLTREAGNFTLCNSCHQGSSSFGFDEWSIGSQAVPGVSGRSHRWDAIATNLGATAPNPGSSDPDEAAMGQRLDDGGKLMCSTCHDVHEADYPVLSGRGRQTISAVDRIAAGTGSLTVGPVAADATGKGYLVEIVAPGTQADALFRLSNDNGRSWFGCSTPPAWDYVAWSDATPNGCVAGGDVPLNDVGKVRVAFASGSYAKDDRFRFYVSYPFLRADVTNSKMCLTCHVDRHMSTADVRGTGSGVVLGTTVFSHPVGAGVNQGAAPLDANGVAQGGAGDGNASNDLVLGSGAEVSCLSCHRVHNADSNSLTADP